MDSLSDPIGQLKMDQSEERMDIDLATAIMEDDIEAFEAVQTETGSRKPDVVKSTGSSIIESSKLEVREPEVEPEVESEVEPEVQECQVRIAPWEKQVCDNFSFPKVSLHRLCQKCPRLVFKIDKILTNQRSVYFNQLETIILKTHLKICN